MTSAMSILNLTLLSSVDGSLHANNRPMVKLLGVISVIAHSHAVVEFRFGSCVLLDGVSRYL